MAKDKKALNPTVVTPEKQRVTGYLDPISHACFMAMCDLWSATSGDGIERLVWSAFNALEAREKEAVATMVRVKTGRSCRPMTPKTSKSTVEPSEGQATSEMDGAELRTNRITSISNRLTNAIDESIASLGS
jgi:hypothetical protein